MGALVARKCEPTHKIAAALLNLSWLPPRHSQRQGLAFVLRSKRKDFGNSSRGRATKKCTKSQAHSFLLSEWPLQAPFWVKIRPLRRRCFDYRHRPHRRCTEHRRLIRRERSPASLCWPGAWRFFGVAAPGNRGLRQRRISARVATALRAQAIWRDAASYCAAASQTGARTLG